MAVNASLAVERVGMPEAQIILAQAVTYIATAPKSNRSCEAVFQAMQEVQATGDLPIPAHLQDAHYKGAAKLGHGKIINMHTIIQTLCQTAVFTL